MEEVINQRPDARLGTYFIELPHAQPVTFSNCYPALACDYHTNTLKICRSVGFRDKYGEYDEVVLAMFSSWNRVTRVED